MLEHVWNFIRTYPRTYELGVTAGVFLFFVLLERFLALHEKGLFRRGWVLDSIYFLVNPIIIKAGMLGVLLKEMVPGMIFVIGLGPFLQMLVPVEIRTFIHGLPLWASLPLAILIADLGFYTAHRMFHSVPWLWPFHAVHHSSEHLDALAAVRVHPVDQIVTKLFSLLPLFALDFAPPAVIGFMMIYLVQSFYVHSNLKGSWGPLRLALATPEFHHWHHADQKEAYDKNFAGQLPIWDLIFGTLQLPKDKSWPRKYGLNYAIPQGYFRQLAYPFVKWLPRKKNKAPTSETTATAEPALAGSTQPTASAVE